MPINFETPAGYYDGNGTFHPNTFLLPTPIPGVSTTQPINPNQPYNYFPDIQPYIPRITLPDLGLPDIPGAFKDFEDTGQNIHSITDNAALMMQLGLVALAYVAFSSAGGVKGVKKGLGL